MDGKRVPVRNVSLSMLAKGINQVHDCVEDTRATVHESKTALEELSRRVTQIETLPMKAIRWIGGLVVAAAVSVGVQNFFLHEETAATSQKAAAQAQMAANTAKATSVQTTAIAKAVGAVP